ncbi:MAG: cation transporting ATPase C-terminal domain-containing protein [Solirubrobacteraceae bacterium]
MNWTAAAELALAVMITQMDLFNRLLKTTPLKAEQFGLTLAAAVLLFVLWEIGKLIARRQTSSTTDSNAPVASQAERALGAGS